MSHHQGMTVTSPVFGPGELSAKGLVGKEGLSQLYDFKISLFTDRTVEPIFKKLMGTKLAVNVSLRGLPPRCYTGVVTSLVASGSDLDHHFYTATIRPTMWLLTRNRACRIFQGKTVPEILTTLFKNLSVRFDLTASYPKHNYCVQYEESDYAFASRLMEEEGMHFSFEFEPLNETLVISDDSTTAPPIPFAEQIPYDRHPGGARDKAVISTWKRVQRLSAAKITLWDHQLQLPEKNFEAKANVKETLKVGDVEHALTIPTGPEAEFFESNPGFAHRFDKINPSGSENDDDLNGIFSDNARSAQIRMDQESANAINERARSNCPAVCPGYSFQLTHHGDGNDHYLVVAVEHRIELSVHAMNEQSKAYRNRFTTLPLKVPFRPKRKTPRPSIKGVHTAVVVGVEGDDISTDPYGRVKVKFHWDRTDHRDLMSSCWLRVATVWAGKGFGTVFIPRIGMEVLVSFVNGDPDMPIVVGCVPNQANMPHHTLPNNRRISGLRTHTVRGNSNQYHELTFDDTPNKEYINLHSERNLYTQAEKTQVVNVGQSLYMTVGLTDPAYYGPAEDPNDPKEPEDTPTRYQAMISGYQEETISRYAAEFVGYEESQTLPLPMPSTVYPKVITGEVPPELTGTDNGDYSLQLAGRKYEYTTLDHYDYVGGKRSTEVDGLDYYLINGGRNGTVNGDNTTNVYGNDYYNVYKTDDANGDQTISIDGNQTVTIKGSQSVTSHKDKWTINESNSYTRNKGLMTVTENLGTMSETVSVSFNNTQQLALSTSIFLGGTFNANIGIQQWCNAGLCQLSFTFTLANFSMNWSNSLDIRWGNAINMNMASKLDVLDALTLEVKTLQLTDCPMLMHNGLLKMANRALEKNTLGLKNDTGMVAVV